jgi:hypothetical protein
MKRDFHSGSRFFPIPDPGSGSHKRTGSRIRWYLLVVSALPQLLMLSELVDRRSVTPPPLGLSYTTENKIIFFNFSDLNPLLFGIPVRVRQNHVCVGAPDPAIFVSDLFSSVTFNMATKNYFFFTALFCLLFLKLYLHNFSKIKSHKEVINQEE